MACSTLRICETVVDEAPKAPEVQKLPELPEAPRSPKATDTPEPPEAAELPKISNFQIKFQSTAIGPRDAVSGPPGGVWGTLGMLGFSLSLY